jgi:glycosyltransferase involved in cell wall biosynthesis
MPEMHVAHVMLSLDVGGLERNVLNQVRQAPRLGQRITIICLERPGALAQPARELGATVICTQKRPGIRVGLVGALRNILREIQPDVVHTHQIGTLFYAGPAALWARIGVVVHTEHGKERYAQQFRTRLLGRFAGRFTSIFFCLTQDMAAAVRASRIVPDRKIRVIFNGIETAQFMQPHDVQGTRRRLGIPEDAPVIGTVGRLTEIKRQDVLIRGFALLNKKYPVAHLLLVGEGPLRADLENLAGACGVRDSVHFAGYQSPTAPFIQAMTIFALTSRSEGMPQAAIEAAVSGLPIVASRVGGLPELIEDGRTGLLFPVGDERALAAALEQLLAHPDRARRIGHAARQHAVATFDISRMADDYQRCFNELLRQPIENTLAPEAVTLKTGTPI